MLPETTILIVDDDVEIVGVVRTLFERERATVVAAHTLADMWRRLGEHPIDLILLDIMLPDGDGMDVLRELRKKNNLPIIMLTGRDAMVDRILGLEFGADDYVGKPFEPRELLARCRSVLRRYASTTKESAPPANRPAADIIRTAGADSVFFGDYQLCMATRTLTHNVHGEIPLTSTEFELLRCLTRAPNRPLNRDQLMDGAFSRDWSPLDRSIDVMIGRLRKKIEHDPANPRLIKTVRGVGYVLAANTSIENRRAV